MLCAGGAVRAQSQLLPHGAAARHHEMLRQRRQVQRQLARGEFLECLQCLECLIFLSLFTVFLGIKMLKVYRVYDFVVTAQQQSQPQQQNNNNRSWVETK